MKQTSQSITELVPCDFFVNNTKCWQNDVFFWVERNPYYFDEYTLDLAEHLSEKEFTKNLIVVNT